MDAADVRKVLLELMKGMSASNGGSFARFEVLKHAAIRLAWARTSQHVERVGVEDRFAPPPRDVPRALGEGARGAFPET